jgi:hypothetical protein
VYICIFDGPELPRGQIISEDNKRRTKTTAHDDGTSKNGAARLQLDYVGGLRMQYVDDNL